MSTTTSQRPAAARRRSGRRPTRSSAALPIVVLSVVALATAGCTAASSTDVSNGSGTAAGTAAATGTPPDDAVPGTTLLPSTADQSPAATVPVPATPAKSPATTSAAELVALRDACAAQDMVACATLYKTAPDGSEFKQFAATCGGLVDASVAGACAHMVEAPFPAVPASATPGWAEQTVRAIAYEAEDRASRNATGLVGVVTAENLQQAFARAASLELFTHGLTWQGDTAVSLSDPAKRCYEVGLVNGAEVYVYSVSVDEVSSRAVLRNAPCL